MTATLPVIDRIDETTTDGDSPTVAGVLLAAGTSSRYGAANKLLATVDDMPVVRHAATTLIESTTDPIVVVTGHESARVESALSDLPVTFVHNPDFEFGQGKSVRAGIDALPQSTDAVVIVLGDMPYVRSGTIGRLVDAFAADAGTALAAGFQGARGNPVLFGRTHFEALRNLTGDTGGRDILLDPSTEAVVVETRDPGVRRDVDVPDDLRDDP